MLPRWIYLRSDDAVFVNLFVGCRGRIENVAGTSVELVQETWYPWSGKVALAVNPARPARFRLCIRVPNRSASALYRAEPVLAPPVIRVNGGRVNPPVRNGYAVLERAWRPGDRVEIELPLVPQRVRADERVGALRGKVALRYGPLVYNIERHEQELEGALPAQAPIEAEWRDDLLGGVVVLRSRFASGGALTAIPNYARMNREPGTEYPARPGNAAGASLPKSIVWIREERGGQGV
jgi:DUF1680 family protein